MPTFSIIVPVYNSERTIKRCVDSIVSQEYSDYEVILVDDGSIDTSGKICDSIAQSNININVFHKTNGGVSSARNAGIKNSKGKYILFVDSDDELLPGSLQLIANKINDSYDLYVFGYLECNSSGNILYRLEGDIIEAIWDREEGLKQMYVASPYHYQGYSVNKIYKRNIILHNNIYFDENISFNEDRLFITKYIASIEREILFDSTPIYNYIMNDNGAMSSTKKAFNPAYVSDFWAQIKMLRIVRKTTLNNEIRELAQQGVLYSYSDIHSMMRKHNAYSRRIHLSMTVAAIFNLSPVFIYKKIILSKLKITL